MGDGVWDVDAARTLSLPFVGVAAGARPERLRAAGAASVLPDLSSGVTVLATLEMATIPSAPPDR